jgi:hypothetical protein
MIQSHKIGHFGKLFAIHTNRDRIEQYNSLPTQRLQVGPTHQIQCQFAFNSRSVRIANNFLNCRGFMQLNHKVMAFLNFARNVMVLC